MEHVLTLIETYRYTVLFPLAALEGPIVALGVGFLVHMGYLNFFLSYVLLVLGDLVPDGIYYLIGRFGSKKKFMEKYGSKSKLISNNFPLLEKLWADHPIKTMFLSKLAYGLSTPFLVSAGLVGMSYKKFAALTLPITLVQYGIIMVLGYYLSYSYEAAAKYIGNVGYVIAGIVVVLIVSYVLLQKYARSQIAQMEAEEAEKIKAVSSS